MLRLASLALCGLGLVTAAQVAWLPAKAKVAQLLLDRAFADSLARGKPVKPWAWLDTAPVARLSVARLGESAVVLGDTTGQGLAFGPTELPSPRGSNVTVLAAHRDTHFAFIQDIRPGDEVTLQRIDGTLARYRVSHLTTVRKDGFAVPRDPPRPLLALATCYPFGLTAAQPPLRRIAWAELVEVQRNSASTAPPPIPRA